MWRYSRAVQRSNREEKMPQTRNRSTRAESTTDGKDPNNLRPKIVKAASKCFRRYGVKKTTIDDITKEVGISRPTFYRFFKDKRVLLLDIANQETRRLVSNNLSLLDTISDIDELFAEAIFRMVKDSRSSEVSQFLLSPENEDLSVAFTDSDNETWQILLDGWRPLLELAEKKGRLRDGERFEDITRWVTAAQILMITRYRALQSPDSSLRDWIVRYIVPSVLLDKDGHHSRVG